MVACSEADLAAVGAETSTHIFWGEAKGLPARGNGLSWADLAEEEEEAARKEAQKLSTSTAEGGKVKLLKGLWFVKEPKPSSNTTDIRLLERQVEELGIQVKRHTEDLNAKKVGAESVAEDVLLTKGSFCVIRVTCLCGCLLWDRLKSQRQRATRLRPRRLTERHNAGLEAKETRSNKQGSPSNVRVETKGILVIDEVMYLRQRQVSAN